MLASPNGDIAGALSPRSGLGPNGAALLNAVRRRLDQTQLSSSTERAYVSHLRGFLIHEGRDDPQAWNAQAAVRYLERLRDEAAPSTVRSCASAIQFMLREVLGQGAVGLREIASPSHRPRPVVFSSDEAHRLVEHLEHPYCLMAALMYGAGLRLHECLSLRNGCFRFREGRIVVLDEKGGVDRWTVLPRAARRDIRAQIASSRATSEADRGQGRLPPPLPAAAQPNDPLWAWCWLFPGERIRGGSILSPRPRASEDGVQRALKRALARTGIEKHGTCQTLRHSFATHLIEANYDMKIVQRLMGHTDLRSTMMYLDIAQRQPTNVVSPLDMSKD